MNIIKCKECGSTAVTATIGANPNDQTPFAVLCRRDCVVEEVYCEDCCAHVDADTGETGDIREVETDQLRLWQRGEADMFVVWHGHYRRGDHTPVAFGHEIFYAAHRAEAWVRDYIEKRCLSPGDECRHSFAIRYFNPKVEVREKLYPSADKIRAIDVNLYPALWTRDVNK